MASEDPSDERDRPMAYDTLRRLERRLDAASAAAERLIAEAAASAARSTADGVAEGQPPGGQPPGGGQPPPAGWQRRQEPDDEAPPRDDLDVLAQFVRSVRELIPPDLQRRLVEALRELLLALRALIDWYLERIERRRAEPEQVQDIPIV